MLPFYKFLSRHDIFLITRYSTKWSTIPVEFSARLYVFFFFYICFCSLLINTRLVFISYFVSVPLRKGHRGLEYQCSFVRLYLFLFAFLIIYIETFCIFDYLHWDFLHFWLFVLTLLVFRRLFCDIFICYPSI